MSQSGAIAQDETTLESETNPQSSTVKQNTHSVPDFVETFDNFLILAERVLQYDTSGEMVVSMTGQSNALQLGLKRYKLVYGQTKQSQKHLQKFQEIYEKCRGCFIKMDLEEFMSWFEEKSSFVISPTPNGRSKLYLTVIFRSCVRIAQHIAEQAEKNPSKAEQMYRDPAAVYPEYFMLYLMRIFYHAADELDRKKLIQPKLKELEQTLGLNEDEAPVIGDGFSELMNAAGEIASELGLDIPKGGMGVGGKELRQALNQIRSDGETKDTVKQFLAGLDLKNTKDFPSMIGKVLNKMQETAGQVPEPVQKSMDATAEDEMY